MVQKLKSFLLYSFVFNNFLVFFLFMFSESNCDFFSTKSFLDPVGELIGFCVALLPLSTCYDLVWEGVLSNQ